MILTYKNSYFHYSVIEVIEQLVILAYGRNFALCQSFLFIFNGYFLPKVATYSQVATTTKNYSTGSNETGLNQINEPLLYALLWLSVSIGLINGREKEFFQTWTDSLFKDE